MADIEFKDNRIEVKRAIQGKIGKFLIEASSLVVAQVAKNTRVKTGQTKNSWKVNVNESENEAIIGSELENAIWEECGTGEYALNGDGRKTAWWYKDKTTGKWHRTKGKKPTRAFYKAYLSTKDKVIQKAEEVFKELE